MMNNISAKLSDLEIKKKTALVSYVVAGDPDLDTSYDIISTLIESGTDIIELGIPFSDPVADGVTIQNASKRSLIHNVNLKNILQLTKRITTKYPNIPIILMGYLNPINQYGIKKFLNDAKYHNVSGLIIVDLPYEEIINYPEFRKKNSVPLINLVTSLTSKERLKKVDKISSEFIYYISVFGTTGTKEPNLDIVTKELKRIKTQTSHKIAVGFGIKSGKQIEILKINADLIVIGSAYCTIIEKNLDDKANLLNRLEIFNQEITKYLSHSSFRT